MINSLYWNFISTVVVLIVGCVITWLITRYYHIKQERHLKKVNDKLFEALNEITKGESYIEYDHKTGDPIRVILLSGRSGTRTRASVNLTVKNNNDERN